MFSFAKFLRISLPVATGACAIVATTLLVATMHDKDKLNKDLSDEILKDLEKPTEEFKEEKIINEEQEEKKEVDSEKEKGAQGPSDKKQELTKEQEKAARDELVQKVMEGQEVVLGENTLRGNDSSTDPKGEDAESPMPNIPSLESSLPEGTSSGPKDEDEIQSVTPDEQKGKFEKPTEGNDDQLDETEASSKESEFQDKSEVLENDAETDSISDDTGMPEEHDILEERASEGEQDLTREENQDVRDGEETEEAAGLPVEEGEPDGGTTKESTPSEQGESKTDSRGGDNDGIEEGTAEDAIPNLDLLNSLEGKLNNEIDSLGARLRSLGIRV